MTPCVELLKSKKVKFSLHAYEHDPSVSSYGLEAAQKLGVDSRLVFKTLVVNLDESKLAVGVIPVEAKLDLKKMAKALGVKKVSLADPKKAQSQTGYMVGGISPLGQKRVLKTIIDSSAKMHEQIYVSAGKRGLDVLLSPFDLANLLGARFDAIALHVKD
jgi:Cys-tRNA(Pro)/Cys-tRNA(Cys) deacylase